MMPPRPPSTRNDAVPSPAEAENGTASFRSKSVRSTLFEVSGVAEGVLGQAMMDLLFYLF